MKEMAIDKDVRRLRLYVRGHTIRKIKNVFKHRPRLLSPTSYDFPFFSFRRIFIFVRYFSSSTTLQNISSFFSSFKNRLDFCSLSSLVSFLRVRSSFCILWWQKQSCFYHLKFCFVNFLVFLFIPLKIMIKKPVRLRIENLLSLNLWK